MSTPTVKVQKNPFALPAVPQSQDGILAVVASSQQDTDNNVPVLYTNPNLLSAAKGAGPNAEYGVYDLDVTGFPMLSLVPAVISNAGSYGVIDHSGITGTLVPTAGATHPFEHYGVIVNFLTAGVIGVSGITYQYSVDNGSSYSAVQALGTATTLTIPNTGVSFTLTATQTVNQNDFFKCPTERPLLSDSDITAAAATLNNSNKPFEMVLFDCNIGASTVGVVDGILAAWELQGKYKIGLLGTRYKLEPVPTGETETAYATAINGLTTQTSDRVLVGADGGRFPSTLTGYNLKRPTSLFAAAMALRLTPNIGIDPAYVSNGPIPNVTITDSNGNPFDHDEFLFPNLDHGTAPPKYTTLRSFAPGGPTGAFINNANIFSSGTSNIQYLQQLRVLNKACSIVFPILTGQLSLGVRTFLNPNTNILNILEADAMRIEDLVNPTLQSALKGQVTGVLFSLSRDDNLGALPVTVTGQVQVVGLAYIKNFSVTVAFSKTLTVQG